QQRFFPSISICKQSDADCNLRELESAAPPWSQTRRALGELAETGSTRRPQRPQRPMKLLRDLSGLCVGPVLCALCLLFWPRTPARKPRTRHRHLERTSRCGGLASDNIWRVFYAHQMARAPKRAYRMVARAQGIEQTRRQIIEAATKLFGQRPFDLVSLADVARASDLALATVVRQFETKDQLFAAAVTDASQVLEAQVDRMPKNDPAAGGRRGLR